MALKLSPISSPDGGRDVAIDLTDALETAETVSGTPTATSSDETILTTSAVDKNSSPIVKDDGTTIAVGKGVQFHIATILAANEVLTVDVYFEGTSNTSETYTVTIPVQATLVK